MQKAEGLSHEKKRVEGGKRTSAGSHVLVVNGSKLQWISSASPWEKQVRRDWEDGEMGTHHQA